MSVSHDDATLAQLQQPKAASATSNNTEIQSEMIVSEVVLKYTCMTGPLLTLGASALCLRRTASSYMSDLADQINATAYTVRSPPARPGKNRSVGISY
jgi:hypothetical protein